MRAILCVVAFIAVASAGFIGDSISDSTLLSIIQQIGLVEGHAAGHSSVQTFRIIQEDAPAKEAAPAAALEEEAIAEGGAGDAAPAAGPGHSDNDYIIKAVLAAKHAAAVKKR